MDNSVKNISNRELKRKLPDFQKELDVLNTDSFKAYEDKLNVATSKAIDALNGIIDDGTLSLDPENLVNAVKVLTKAKTDIMDSRRKLVEVLVRGEVMLTALEEPKNANQDNVLLEYLKKHDMDERIAEGEKGVNSIFEEVEKLQNEK